MKVKTQTEIYELLIKNSIWVQNPDSINPDLTIITIVIPNRNVRQEEYFQGIKAVNRILAFSCGFLFDTLLMQCEESLLKTFNEHHIAKFKSSKEFTKQCLKLLSELS